MTNIRLLASVALLMSVAAGVRAGEGSKKLYCWNENGHKICGDALPAEAAQSARTEFSAKSGMHTGDVARALTTEERAAAAQAAEQAQVALDAETSRQRRDLAMVESYATEDDLRRAYGERIDLLDDALKTSMLGETNLRLSLVSLLDQASDLELSGKPVPPILIAKLRGQHDELARQTRILGEQQRDRAALDGDLADAVTRYRALKQAQADNAAGIVTPTPAPPAG
ncbi:hypothetical protein [Cognatiluteimonas profundi]|uniref:hypothetical protein n=1 Tax=Cognatiluteimonas profundi TaxID=2594501 RepID=UPI00131DBBAF|nr:hypothetical protein [Lysobacter profundi]